MKQEYYRTIEIFNVITFEKAQRGPFYWRLLTQKELTKRSDPLLQYGVFSKGNKVEGYATSQHVAAWLADKWNDRAALAIMLQGTGAEQAFYWVD